MVQFKDVQIGNLFVFTEHPERIYVKINNDTRLEIRQKGLQGASCHTAYKGADITILQINSVSGTPSNKKVELGYTDYGEFSQLNNGDIFTCYSVPNHILVKLGPLMAICINGELKGQRMDMSKGTTVIHTLSLDTHKEAKPEQAPAALKLFECTFKELKIGEAFQCKHFKETIYIKNSDTTAIVIKGKYKHAIYGIDEDQEILLGEIDISSFEEEEEDEDSKTSQSYNQFNSKVLVSITKPDSTSAGSRCHMCNNLHYIDHSDKKQKSIYIKFEGPGCTGWTADAVICKYCAKKIVSNITLTIDQLNNI